MLAFRGIHAGVANEPRASAPIAGKCRRVLALVDLTAPGEAVLRYASGIAVKNRSALMAAHVIDSRPWFESDGPCGRFLPEEQLFFTARATARKLDLFLARNNVSWAESTVLYGKTNEALARLIGHWKPDLIVADARTLRHRAIAGGLASARGSTQVLPLERAEGGRMGAAGAENRGLREGKHFGDEIGKSAKPAAADPARLKQLARTALLGVGTGVLYWWMFANEREVLELSSKGHWYFVLPLVIAFVFSFVHGAFTADFWDALGVKASRKR